MIFNNIVKNNVIYIYCRTLLPLSVPGGSIYKNIIRWALTFCQTLTLINHFFI